MNVLENIFPHNFKSLQNYIFVKTLYFTIFYQYYFISFFILLNDNVHF